jgi:hypothetical protein
MPVETCHNCNGSGKVEHHLQDDVREKRRSEAVIEFIKDMNEVVLLMIEGKQIDEQFWDLDRACKGVIDLAKKIRRRQKNG